MTPWGVGSVRPIGWVFRAERSGFLTGTSFSSKWANLIYDPAQVSLIPTHSQACWGERALDFSPLSSSRCGGKRLGHFLRAWAWLLCPFWCSCLTWARMSRIFRWAICRKSRWQGGNENLQRQKQETASGRQAVRIQTPTETAGRTGLKERWGRLRVSDLRFLCLQGGGQCTGCINDPPQEKIIHDKDNVCRKENKESDQLDWNVKAGWVGFRWAEIKSQRPQ